MPAAKAQASLCIDISSTEPKHWNINKRVIRTNFLKKKSVSGNTHSEHLFRACNACPDTKIKILNHGPRVSNRLDTDHD